MSRIQRLLDIMRQLRDPEHGCPWDIAQTFDSIAPFTIEEAYEVADAIARGDFEHLREELGDLLLQVVYHAQMAEEQSHFRFSDVVDDLSDKLVARHPHVFGQAEAKDTGAVKEIWESRKERERRDKRQISVVDDVPLAFPALLRAHKLQKRVSRVGFDWSDIGPVFDKVREELGEVEAAWHEVQENDAGEAERAHLEEELGDLLFVVTNLARHCGFRAEEALRKGNDKFERRFRAVEAELVARGREIASADLTELDAAWEVVKRREKSA
ncbi:MAG: nucleoside triphosphate pyrophosphohydrolase [Pseudomonadota bacterium]